MNKAIHSISIRKASTDDATLISVLAAATFYEAYFEQDEPGDLAEYIHDSFEIASVEREIADPASSFQIILRDGKAVGYAKLIDGSTHSSVTSHHPVELKRI